MHFFHCADLSPDTVELSREESHHLQHVLRIPAGSVVGLVDGQGTTADAKLLEVGKRRCTARILRRERHPRERKASVHLAVAPTKKIDRFEWFLEKATEIGVDRITPIHTKNSERKRLRQDRLEKLLISAMKQSQRTWLPRLDALTKLNNLKGEAPQKFFGWCEGDHVALTSVYDPKRDALLVIGPEGDFTAEEAEWLIESNFQAVNLGPARLRTETAAIAACTWMNFAQH